jgi:[acyl-carrier-protein] S-malonyltransferase|tara:strand:+ start:4597 stop:5529 length:933 start_codon:yes stop_codon:yes gene_type:complete
MFSVIFPGQGSQSVGMTKELHDNFAYVKDLFNQADDILGYSISETILEGPKEDLDLTENTQPAIFLASYSIFEMIKRESNINLGDAKYFAGHSLGEYSALATSGSLDFKNAIKLLNQRGKAMQAAVPKGTGGMVAVLGVEIKEVNNLLEENQNNYKCYIANDNSNGQIVLSGLNSDIDKFIEILKTKKIKNIKLPVSAPFHCKLMDKATSIMRDKINNTNFEKPKNVIISNVTGSETQEIDKIKDLLIKQIESPVRWRESVIYMIKNGVTNFIEIGPGKVLSGLVKRIDKTINVNTINKLEDIKNIKLND